MRSPWRSYVVIHAGTVYYRGTKRGALVALRSAPSRAFLTEETFYQTTVLAQRI